MKLRPTLLYIAVLLGVIVAYQITAQAQQRTQAPTIKVTSSLVFLDVTVLDKKGHPVVTGLTKDDFTITEDNKPQRIFSFEAPEAHVMSENGEDENLDGEAPATIFVLDLLNSRFEDFAYIRYEVTQFLKAQPPQLASPAELLVLYLEMLQSLDTQ